MSGRWEKLAGFEFYRIAARLTDDAGRTWGQWDRQPAAADGPFESWVIGEGHVARFGFLVDAGTPPGRYQLRLSVRAGDDRPLEAVPASDQPPGVELTIGVVDMVRPAPGSIPARCPLLRA